MYHPSRVLGSHLAEEYVKVILNTSDKHFIAYIRLQKDWSVLLKEIMATFPEQDFKVLQKYWIDYEGDKVDIVDEKSYKIFLKMSEIFKIYLEDNTKTKTQSPKPDETALEAHANVVCDSCGKSPIIGFRYKCVQCPDFDLCGECEGKRIHKEHVMFRFPAPLKTIPFNRRFLKKMKKGCFIHHEGEEGASRRHHGRRHCRNNIFSSLYTMMQDMAEGTEGPTAEDESGHSDEEAEKSTKKNEKESESTPRPRKCKRHDTQQIDPSYLKAGVEILGNFSEMFSKMINPTVTVDGSGEQSPSVQKSSDNATKAKNVEILGNFSELIKLINPPVAAGAEGVSDGGEPSRRSEEKTGDDSSKDKNENKSDKDETVRMDESPEKNIENAGNANAENSNASLSLEGASALIPDQPSTSKPATEQDKDESDWTVINPPGVALRRDSTNSSCSSGVSRKSGTQADSVSKEESPSADYAKISKDLYEHLQREEKKAAAKVETPPKPAVQAERRALIVYHTDKRINNAVHAMMGMGFSNEGNWLTYLLESVNGDIAQAIDLMKPVK